MSNITYPRYKLPDDLNVNSVTASNILVENDIIINGTASINVVNTIESNKVVVGDKYIVLASGSNSQNDLDGAGILFGSGSDETPVGDENSVAYILYRNDSGDGRIDIFPSLNVSGSMGNGFQVSVLNDYSHAEGYKTTTTGQYSHAEGFETTASNEGAHAEGLRTKANGVYSHAEGWSTEANGMHSHAEGEHSYAVEIGSHAEGYNTQASGPYSHAEGSETNASGQAAHAEGQNSLASGIGSHTEGLMTTASADYQHVQGKYNSTSSTAIMLVGNGTSDIARSNILEVYQTNVTISGSLNVSSSISAFSYTGSLFGTASYSQDSAKLGNVTSSLYALKTDVTGATSNFPTRIEVSGAITGALTPYALSSAVSSSFVTNAAATASLAFLTASNTFTANQIIDISSSLPALRVTQRGAGPVIAIEDSANPDTSAFAILNDGTVAIGVDTGSVIPTSYKLYVVGKIYSNSDIQTPGYVYTNYLSALNGIFTTGLNGFVNSNYYTGSLYTASNGYIGRLFGTSSYSLDSDLLDGYDSSYFASLTGVSSSFTTPTQVSGAITGALSNYITGAVTSGNITGSGIVDDPITLKDHISLNSVTASVGIKIDGILLNGSGVSVLGGYSHAEGSLTIADGLAFCHAEGQETRASGLGAHSEGYAAIAYGESSHAEGNSTVTHGGYSHAEGSGSITYGEASHAEGLYTITSASYQHAQGKYNATSSTALMLVGNGANELSRSNILEVYTGSVNILGQSVINGGQAVKVSSKTSNYSLIASSDYILTFSGSNLTGTLPSASTCAGSAFIIKNKHSSPLYITSSGGNIDGNGAVTISLQYHSYTLVSDGIDWNII